MESLRPLLSSRVDVGNAWGALPARCAEWLGRHKPVLLVVPGPQEAEAAVQDLETFGAREPLLIPELEILDAPGAVRTSDRIKAVLAGGAIRVASIRAALEPVPPLEGVEKMKLARGDRLEDLPKRLVDLGYERVPAAESQGEFAVRGGVIDIFPLGHDWPVRIELDDDRIGSLRLFDVEDQASKEEVPFVEFFLTRLAAAGYDPDAPDMLDALPDALVLLTDPTGVEDHVRRFYDKPKFWQERKQRFLAKAAGRPGGNFSPLPGAELDLPAGPPPAFQGNLATLAHDLAAAGKVIVYASKADGERLAGLAKDAGIEVEIRTGRLSKGFTFDGIGYVAHHEVFQRKVLRRVSKRRRSRPLDEILELNPGDYVVHKHYGVGRFSGVERVKTPEREYDAVVIGYHGGSKLFVPVQDLSLVQKYVAPADAPVGLSRLHTRGWTETRAAAVRGAAELAKDLVEIQARRRLMGGVAYPADDDMQRLFEAAFPYEDTDDQAGATVEIKEDLCAPRAMDRLLCGDVGFGKTELAMRAAFKAVTAGRQVALMCPTTILAQQHYRTFRDRMADYPVSVDVLSRFRTRKEQSRILDRLAVGELDIVIGTHRLAQKDVRFKALGMLVIDEEQRFGVEHKEMLKRFRATVDVLTLTATPIPRTLHMALLTIRDISVLSTAPHERLAVQTSVIPYSEDRIRDAILFELERDGQVFFLHNRVHSIRRVTDRLREIVPEAKFTVGHGQMPAHELEEAMLQFVNGEADVLVSTTIIENGIDIPNANTMLIDNADQFGLSDLHQLRGRVGRYHRQAYTILLLPEKRRITPEASQRLSAIEELSHLGAGFKIALRDMEIRGVGNILGREQHGHIKQVGYELYLELLEREVAKMQKKPVEEIPDAGVVLNLSAFVPADYVPDMAARVEFYRRLARTASEKGLEELGENARDRFGAMSEPVRNLFTVQRVKIAMKRQRLASLAETNEYYIIKYTDPKRAEALHRADADRIRIVDRHTLYVPRSAGIEGLLEALGSTVAYSS